jgi:hypothetical protein
MIWVRLVLVRLALVASGLLVTAFLLEGVIRIEVPQWRRVHDDDRRRRARAS